MSLELYERYLTALETTANDGKLMPYEWGRLPKSLDVGWMPYRNMFDEFSREIANSLPSRTWRVFGG
jgi:hypothetical protein